MQELLRAGMGRNNASQFLAPDHPRVLLAHHRRIRLGVLPIQALMTGRSYCLQRLDRVTVQQTLMLPCAMSVSSNYRLQRFARRQHEGRNMSRHASGNALCYSASVQLVCMLLHQQSSESGPLSWCHVAMMPLAVVHVADH